MRKAVRLTVRLLAVLVILAVLAMFAGLWAMRVSLPALEGELQLAGLSAPVLVSRDERGIATLEAANEADAARALGFVHAQERYFEMDLLRRSAAGELSALFGPIAIERDKEIRIHRLRARLAEHLGQATDGHLAALEAYRDGVNDGLLALQTRPWPYLLLRAQPEP